MRVLSLFSGAGGMDLGLERAGMEIVAHCEIDPKPRSVLARHWPDVPCWEDVEDFDGSVWDGRVDVVAGGSPCTDLSVAGRRAGLDGVQSRLFWHQCRVARESSARWVLWENVAGALSSNDGADFAAVLWGLTGTLPGVPDGGWSNMGFTVGPERWAVWRVLDAQWFGVAQRRRRVFVVAGPRDEPRPQILFEPESLRGSAPPSREPGADTPHRVDGGARSSRGPLAETGDVVTGLTGGFGNGGADDNKAQAGWLIPERTGTVTANWWKGQGNTQVDEGILIPFDTTQITSKENRSNPQSGDPSHTLPTTGHPPTIVFDSTMGGMTGIFDDGTTPPVKIGSGIGIPSPPAVLQDGHLEVRRLTPRECERLMGWPDDWTRWTADSHEIADAHRYKMCGNGVVAPVAQWIATRMITHT